MLPPPPGHLKRKTLAEKAGEPPRPAPPPPNSRPLGVPVKTTSIAGLSRQNSFSSSASSRPNSSASSYRNVSNSSFAGSVCHNRAQSSQSYRPYTSISAHITQPKAAGQVRPATSIDSHTNNGRSPEFDGPANSMRHVSSSLNLRKRFATSMSRKTSWESNESQTNHREVRPSSTTDMYYRKPHVKSLRDISLITQSVAAISLTASTVFLPPEEEEAERPCSPHTPSQIPKRKRSATPLSVANASPLKSCKKTSRVGGYLSKDSNIKLPDWDLGNRVENMESMYAELAATMKSTTAESNNIKDNNNLLKARGIPKRRPCLFHY